MLSWRSCRFCCSKFCAFWSSKAEEHGVRAPFFSYASLPFACRQLSAYHPLAFIDELLMSTLLCFYIYIRYSTGPAQRVQSSPWRHAELRITRVHMRPQAGMRTATLQYTSCAKGSTNVSRTSCVMCFRPSLSYYLYRLQFLVVLTSTVTYPHLEDMSRRIIMSLRHVLREKFTQ